MRRTCMKGPIDYIIVGFQGNKFDGSILKSISEAIDKKIINLIALAFVMKDEEGTISTVDIVDTGDDETIEFAQKYQVDSKHIDANDIDETADLIPNNTAAGLLIIEHTWAIPLKEALVNANGVLLAEGRIHPDAAKELEGAAV